MTQIMWVEIITFLVVGWENRILKAYFTVYITFFVCFLVQMSGTYIFAKFMNINCGGEDVQRLQANKGLGRPY